MQCAARHKITLWFCELLVEHDSVDCKANSSKKGNSERNLLFDRSAGRTRPVSASIKIDIIGRGNGTVCHSVYEIADKSFLIDLIFVAFCVVETTVHSVGYLALRRVLIKSLAHLIGLIVSIVLLLVGTRNARSRIHRLEESVGKLDTIGNVVGDTEAGIGSVAAFVGENANSILVLELHTGPA